MTSNTAPLVKPVVLAVDDVAANRELLEAYLVDLGYEVRQPRDGLEAMEAIEADEPDLIRVRSRDSRLRTATCTATGRDEP